jgi:hypothetical protein
VPPSPKEHFKETAVLAKALTRKYIYEWLVTSGYFPEPYVLPPCFKVLTHPPFQKRYFSHTKKKFSPRTTEYIQVHFPKTEVTDRTFGIIHPDIHSDIARTIAKNWAPLMSSIFDGNNLVCAYSFPIPLDKNRRGTIGKLRSGRMIYEFIEMAEQDLATIAYRFKFLITTDIKNFYPSIYTHSIPWAIHGKKLIRSGSNRHDFQFFGNRLDKLFQNAYDGCTNGIPIGPAVSDLISEVVLSGVDRMLSKRLVKLADNVSVVRFKDDYRILARTREEGRSVVKELQAAAKEYRLELNDEKTQFHELPSGLFREWVSRYNTANPRPKKFYSFRRFKEVYLSVVAIDGERQAGIIDRFLADLIDSKNSRLRMALKGRSLFKVVSLLLMLADRRTKAFPMVLAILESILRSPLGKAHSSDIEKYLVEHLERLSKAEAENRYLIAWILYFLRANALDGKLSKKIKFTDPIVRAIRTSRFTAFKTYKDFKVFQTVKQAAKQISMLDHLAVFKPQ